MSSAPCRADWMISAILMWKLTIPASISGITRTDHLSQTPALFRETSAAETAHRMASLRLHTNRKMPHCRRKLCVRCQIFHAVCLQCRHPRCKLAQHIWQRDLQNFRFSRLYQCASEKGKKTVSDSTGRHSGNCLLPGTGYADGRKHTHLQCILL